MTRPGFRKSRPGAARGTGLPGASARAGGADAADGFLSASLFSQAQILHLMRNEFARARRHGIPLGCVLMQVDRMAQLVDLYGVALRQTVRQALSDLVRSRTRGADLLGATNEDRYLLLLPHTDGAHSRLVAERLHGLFQTLAVEVDGRELALSLSVGVSASGSQPAMFFDTLVGQAEAALEHAMGSGGNRVVSFGELPYQDEGLAGSAAGGGREAATHGHGVGGPGEAGSGGAQQRDGDQRGGARPGASAEPGAGADSIDKRSDEA